MLSESKARISRPEPSARCRCVPRNSEWKSSSADSTALFIQKLNGPGRNRSRSFACPIFLFSYHGKIVPGNAALKVRPKQSEAAFSTLFLRGIFQPRTASRRDRSRPWLSCSCRHPTSTCPCLPSSRTSHPGQLNRRLPAGWSSRPPSPWHRCCGRPFESSMHARQPGQSDGEALGRRARQRSAVTQTRRVGSTRQALPAQQRQSMSGTLPAGLSL